MTVARDITLPVDQQRLKTACAELVRAFGGQVAAAHRLNTRQQRISDCCSKTTDAFLRIDEIAVLEAETIGYPGHPHVTSLLASRIDAQIVTTPRVTATGKDLLQLYAAQARETADLAGEIAAAQMDGEIRLHEARRIDAEIDQVIAGALAMRAEVRMIIRESGR